MMEEYREWAKWAWIAGSIILVLFVAIFLRTGFFTFVDNYELGYKFDSRSGQITILKDPGYNRKIPIVVSIHTIDMRPMQVCINANQRVLNCKLVQFNPAGIELFLSWHGRDDYHGPGTGNQSGATPFSEILKSYAYDGSSKIYPFLTVVRELKPEEVIQK